MTERATAGTGRARLARQWPDGRVRLAPSGSYRALTEPAGPAAARRCRADRDVQCRTEPDQRGHYPAFAALAAVAGPGRCPADTTRRILTCLMPSMRKPARSVGLNAACTRGVAFPRLLSPGWVASEHSPPLRIVLPPH